MELTNILTHSLSQDEKSIKSYKDFYKLYLFKIAKRREFQTKLLSLCKEFSKDKLFSTKQIELKKEAENLLEIHLGKSIISLFNKEFPLDQGKDKAFQDEGDSFWGAVLKITADIGTIYKNVQKKRNDEWEYKVKFLKNLYFILINYGLHPKISERNQDLFKRFNILIRHSTSIHTKQMKEDCRILLQSEEFNAEFIKPYSRKKSIKVVGKLIPFKNIREVKISTTLLLDDEIELFAQKNNFSWCNENKDYLTFLHLCVDETEKYHPIPLEDGANHYGDLNPYLLKEVKDLLKAYPKSSELFSKSLEDFNSNIYDERSLIDGLRLSLELLLKDVLKNSKSLEKQAEALGKYQTNRGDTKEIRSMFWQLLDLYAKYQNNYIKHNNNVNPREIEFIFELTLVFMKFLLKK